MTKNNDKRFFDFFKRYKTDDKTRQMLESGTNVRVRLSKDPLRLEIYITFPMVLRNHTLYTVEQELCAYCEAESVRIFPTYPSSLFDVCFMEDVVEEAVRSGVIVKGYFDEAVYEDDGETVRAVLPFVDTALSFMSSSGTCEVLERILSLRFSIARRVLVVASHDAEARTKQRLERNAEILREADRQALEEMRAAMRARAEAEEEEKDPHADFTRVSSLIGGEATVEVDDAGLVRIGNMCFDTEGSEAILGEAFSFDRIKMMSEVTEPRGTHVIFGEVFSVETKEKNDGARIQATVGIYDGSSSLYIKKTSEAEEAGWISALKAGKCIAVKGTLYADRFDGETLISPKAIMTLKKHMRKDTAEEKRVELHLHTVMSTMDAVIHPSELVNTAIAWGHKAIAVTDHGTVQAFPEVMLAVEKAKSDLKIIYGIEAYYVNDEVPTVAGFASPDYGQPTVVFEL